MSKNLVDVLTEQGLNLTESSNGRWVTNCPFHEGDRNPSFTVYPNETYYCFGCKVWGNPVKFLIDKLGWSVEQAVEHVGQDYHLPRSEKRVIKVKNILKTSRFLYDVALRYHKNLVENPGPIKYLTDRGLNTRTIANHMIGYTDGTVLNFTYAEEYDLANEVGLLNKGGYETLSHRIVIPNVIDHEYVDFMTGRTVINEKPKYLGLRMSKPIMGFHQYRHSPILFMVEGQFDWLLLKQWGYPAVVMSGSHITKANATLLKGKFIVYIPDSDNVGEKAAQSIIETFGHLSTAVIDISEFTAYKDLSEANQYEPLTEDMFRDLVNRKLCDTRLLNPTWSKYVPQLNIPASLVSI